jgi:hypothetical protein
LKDSISQGDGMPSDGILDQKERAAEKANSRRWDADDLAAGRVTREELALRNDFFHGFDLSGFEIEAVGGTVISQGPRGATKAGGGGDDPP